MTDFSEGLLVFSQSQESNNKSVMPLDVLGPTHATLSDSANHILFESPTWWGLIIAIIDHERKISSKDESPVRVDYIPALCTHCLLLLLIEWLSEVFRLVLSQLYWHNGCQKVDQTWSFRGSKSSNKDSVSEPLEVSLLFVNMRKATVNSIKFLGCPSGFKCLWCVLLL